MSPEYIYVYGSLRKGFSFPARDVLDNQAEYIGDATFQGKLFEIDWYPGAVPSDNGDDIVYGEVYKLNENEIVLSKLDQYEGCSPADPKPHAFIRKEMKVTRKNGDEITAWIYLYDLLADDKAQILSGDYTITQRRCRSRMAQNGD